MIRIARGNRRCGAAAAAVLALAGGCSLIYDGGEFMTGDPFDAAPDPDAVPTPDAEPPQFDVDVSALALVDLEPAMVPEGAGAVRPIPIVIHGSSMASDAVVTLDGLGFVDEVVDAEISSDGKLAAFALTVPVLTELAEGSDDTIAVTVSQGVDIEQSLDLVVNGLNEFTASDDAAGGTFSADDLRPLYSTVNIDAAITLTGTVPARFVATADMQVRATLIANGGNAAGATPGAGGPGGCAGGAAEGPGDCLDGGGRGGATGSGGGGGGHATAGTGGAGDTPGDGGAIAGNPEITPLADARGNGGGGGGPGSLSAAGTGGGGGGTVELTSHGTLTVDDAFAANADGGAGSDGGGGICALLERGGGGGGGAGGTVFVRATGVLADEGSDTRISVAAGTAGNLGACNNGGAGSVGRVRVDVPGDAATPAFAGAEHYRGPVLAPNTPVVVTAASQIVRVFGGASQSYALQREGDAREAIETTSNRRVDIAVELEAGLNRVCAVVNQTASLGSPEGANCLDIAYID
jgi:hypothetical protein